MKRYTVKIREQAQIDLGKLFHDEPKAYHKALQLISEL